MKLIDHTAKTNWKFIAVIIIIGVVFGVILIWHYVPRYTFRDPHEAQILERQKREYEQKIIELNKHNTSTWQTYRNKEFGFEVRYPPTWFLENNNTLPSCHFSSLRFFVFINQQNYRSQGKKGTICVIDALPGEFMVSIHEGISSLPQPTSFSKFKKFVLDREEGVYTFTRPPGFREDIVGGLHTSIFVNHDLHSYFITHPNLDYEGRHEQIYDQILSTFRFIK